MVFPFLVLPQVPDTVTQGIIGLFIKMTPYEAEIKPLFCTAISHNPAGISLHQSCQPLTREEVVNLICN